jgi:putative peptide zinc metalloprotease protein
VQVRLAHEADVVAAGRIVRHVPAGNEKLPSLALTAAGGGKIAVDPRDSTGAKTLAKVFQLDIELPPEAPLDLYGQRVHVRFDHLSEPLGRQWYRSVRELFLARFNV